MSDCIEVAEVFLLKLLKCDIGQFFVSLLLWMCVLPLSS